MPAVADRVEKNLGPFIFAGAFLSSAATILFGLNSIPAFALALSFLVCVFGQLKNIPQQTVIQMSVPKYQLPTVFTTLGAIGTGTFGLASLLMGVLADAFGIRTVFVTADLLLAAARLIAFKGRVFFWKTVQE